ncbi:glycosyltransferase family 2 protein [Patescibacteria group bacterium]|nr:glycosyltransferase family 2 protein [Patescibacteria group bacterium]MBU0777362.1 glycosyltransferase family 2 protein [Patescibacteria group bacterium]MBU0845990.1 glycosyltransferase family 2 protein [Patescibacteria group bacterium]MBU0922538.1 glycosyltransferase family 2 protein [Patescibacteria group bacterium]MBU1066529.1 glycosyltransferase family 2 protein [Patescibacteria group bacterium]
MNIFIVIPAHQEEERIGNVIKDVIKTNFPIIVVDDGSKDETFNVASKYKITVLRHKVNLGKGAAMKTGAEAAFRMGADAVVFMDSDGQHKVKDLPHFTDALEKDKFDVIFGSRNLNHGVPFVRYMGNKFASLLVSLLFGIYVSDLLCGYRGLSKKGFEKIYWESKGYGVETEMAARTAKSGLKYCEAPVETVYYDEVKGVTILDAISILFDVLRWRIRL